VDAFGLLTGAPRVTSISAPAGSGKTCLVRSWAADPDRAGSVAWVLVPGGEQEPRRFWTAVVDALRKTTTGSKLVRPVPDAPDLDCWTVVGKLLEDLGTPQHPIWLVIDDLHELRSAQALAQLELLLVRAPAELRLILVTRGDLRLGLHRLRLQGELAEIRAADLRFSVAQARELFCAAGVDMPQAALAALVARTEGWAAGLRLAALSAARHPQPERFAGEFSGSERTVADYLLAEVLDRQPDSVRRLLLRTSICERVSGELADLLTAGSGGEQILQDLEAAGAFVNAVDAHRSWFRYHTLFADLLRLELRRTEPAELPALHSAAAGWFAKHGYPAEAIRHAQAAMDWGMAARLLWDHFAGPLLDGGCETANELLTKFAPESVETDPELAALTASDEIASGCLDAAARHVARAAKGLACVPVERRPRLETALLILRLRLAREHRNLPAIAEEARRLLGLVEPADAAQLDPDDDVRALALVHLGIAELLALEPRDAERHLGQGAAIARRAGRPFLEVSAMAHHAWAASFQSFGQAVEQSLRATKLARANGWTEEPVIAVAYATLGSIRVWQAQFHEAEEVLGQAGDALRGEVEPAAALVLHQAHGMLELARGNDIHALATFRAAERLAGSLATPHQQTAPLRAHVLQTLVRLGECDRAETALAGLEDTRHGEIQNAFAALRLAQGDPQGATCALKPVLDGSAPVTNPGWMTQAFLLAAIAREALGEVVAAGQALEHALDIAEPDGALFAFLLHPVPTLLRRCARHSALHAPLIGEILDLLTEHGFRVLTGPAACRVADGSPASNGPLEPLVPLGPAEPITDSETRVLRYLPTNLRAHEIAAELCLSVNTVRTHMRHLYAKLDAHRRTEAVDRARALGLLATPFRKP
jgi:LuxR family maltose regulon positive regulatory protein